jgi:hypothetical protein
MTVFDEACPGDGWLARYGIEPFGVGYGASFAARGDPTLDIECQVVEDGRTLQADRPQP